MKSLNSRILELLFSVRNNLAMLPITNYQFVTRQEVVHFGFAYEKYAHGEYLVSIHVTYEYDL